MFKDNEILQHIQNTEEGISNIGAVINTLLQKLEALQEQRADLEARYQAHYEALRLEYQAHYETLREQAKQTAQPIDKRSIYNEIERDRKAAARANKKNANTNATTEETPTNG